MCFCAQARWKLSLYAPIMDKVNHITKTDTFPIPRIDDCIDNVGKSKFVTNFDLLKGFWQVPLTERAKEICLCHS